MRSMFHIHHLHMYYLGIIIRNQHIIVLRYFHESVGVICCFSGFYFIIYYKSIIVDLHYFTKYTNHNKCMRLADLFQKETIEKFTMLSKLRRDIAYKNLEVEQIFQSI